MPEAVELITAEEFAILPDSIDGTRTELWRGCIVARPLAGFRCSRIITRIGCKLGMFAIESGLGRATFSVGIITGRNPDTVLAPHAAYWSYDRLPRDFCPVGYPEVAPEVCIVLKQPGMERVIPLIDKLREYCTFGVRMVWVIDPEDKTVTIFRTPERGQILHCGAMVDGEDVLPGFNCPVSEFFA